MPLLSLTNHGFYCEAGDFFVDPWRPVPRAVVTHAHADHFSPECGAYLVSQASERLFKIRLGNGSRLQTIPYGEQISIGGVQVSLHPAGHILGSAQVRIEHQGEVWVMSGDYKIEPDPTCAPFELLRCHTFITEATFGLPVYRWPSQDEVFAAINSWWRANQEAGRASILFAYALGKAQRFLAGLDVSIGPIYTHGAVEHLNQAYRQSGIPLPATKSATQIQDPDWRNALIVAPPSARGTPWLRRFGPQSSGFASGWMRVRGMRRRRSVDRGFVLSDHVDWPGLLETIKATGAEHIWVTHGYVPVVVRWLREQGVEAQGFQTQYSQEGEEAGGHEEE